MVVSPSGKKTAGAHKRPRRTLLANLHPVFPCGLMPVKHEMPSVSLPEFTTLTHNDPLLERFLRRPRVCCSGLGATAHLSGQNLLTFQGIYHLGFQLKHKAMCTGGGCLTRHSHYLRVRLGGVTIWRLQCTTCHAVFTVLPPFVLRYRPMRPKVARDALLATHGGLSLELCAVISHISPMALYRLVCAFGHQSLVAVLTGCGLPLPPYFLADEKHSRCLTDKVYLPTIVTGRVLWHLG